MEPGREKAKLGQRLARVALRGREQLADRVVGHLAPRDADREHERDEPLLRAVVQVALEPAPLLVGGGDETRARDHQLLARLGARDGEREQRREGREPVLDVVVERLVRARRDDHRAPRLVREQHRRGRGRDVARLAHARRHGALAVRIDPRGRPGPLDRAEGRVVADRHHRADREQLLLRRAAPAPHHRRALDAVAHDGGRAHAGEPAGLDRDRLEDQRRIGLAGDERRDAAKRRLLAGEHLDLGEPLLELAVQRLHLGRRRGRARSGRARR